MSKRDIGAEILDGLKEIQAHKQGRLTLRTTRLSEPSLPQALRGKRCTGSLKTASGPVTTRRGMSRHIT